MDEEHLVQYKTPFRCSECGENVFQTDAEPAAPSAFVGAECTNCGNALTAAQVEQQKAMCAPSDIQAMMAKFRATQ